jgi:hypothetical protein
MLLISRAEQSSSLLPATSQHGHSWHRAPLGPMAILLTVDCKYAIKSIKKNLLPFLHPYVFQIFSSAPCSASDKTK